MLAALVLPLLLSCAVAVPNGYSSALYGPSYHAPPVSYTATDVGDRHGALRQQTAVGKDAHGGHTIRHSAQATRLDPHSGLSAVRHEEHEFHINPYRGEAAVHTNNAEGSLNPTLGKAAYSQKSHEAKIAPGHASVADAADTAEVSSHGSAASRDVQAARTDAMHDGLAKNAHASHKSYATMHGVGGKSKEAESNERSFDGHGYGHHHYDARDADEAYDHLGHAAANEKGYKLDTAYDKRVNLGASNELQYSRHAAHDPYGNYGAVTQTRQASQGGQLVPVEHVYAPLKEEVYVAPVVKETAVYVSQPAVKEVVYGQPESYAYAAQPISYEPLPVSYQKQSAMSYDEPAAYQKQVSYYSEPVSYQKQYVYQEAAPVSYQKRAALVYDQPAPVVYKRPYRAAAYTPEYDNEGYYY